MVDGVVFRCFRSCPGGDDQLQLVVPQQLITGVLTSLHASCFSPAERVSLLELSVVAVVPVGRAVAAAAAAAR